MQPESDFVAEWVLHFRNSKPVFKRFTFPQSGIRHVPAQIEGLEGLNTVTLFGGGGLNIDEGETVRLGGRVLFQEVLKRPLKTGLELNIWDGDFFASGHIVRVEPASTGR